MKIINNILSYMLGIIIAIVATTMTLIVLDLCIHTISNISIIKMYIHPLFQ